jgi:hypothetical protein
MATLAELWDEAPVAPVKSTPVRAAGFPVVTPDVQRTRDAGRQQILSQELAAEQAKLASATTPEARQLAQYNIESINREIGGKTAKSAATPVTMTTPAPAGNTLADLWESTPAAGAPKSGTPVAPASTKTEEQQLAEAQRPITVNPQAAAYGERKRAQQIGEPPVGAVGELARSLLQSAIVEPLAAGAGVIGGAIHAIKTGQAPAPVAADIRQALTEQYGYTPTSERGRELLTAVANIPEKITGSSMGLPPVTGTGPGVVLAPAVVSQVTPKITKTAGDVAQAIGEATKKAEEFVGEVGAARRQMTDQFAQKRAPAVAQVQPSTGMVSAGAAAAPNEAIISQALSVATPELRESIKNIPVNKVNVPTLQRHIEADSLPIPVRLTEGQATGDIVKLSQEQNRRGQDPALAQRFNEQNNQLVENIGAIRERAAPDVYGTKTIENSQSIIDAYKKIDDARNTDIRTAYKALEDANGGQFPVDGKTLANNADNLLSKKLKTEFLPSSIRSQLERFKAGEQMTFEQFEAMRTNLAAEIRKAERSGDGNAAMASNLVRQALEDLPMPEGTATNLKAIADNARNLAKQRFDMLKKDPAYKAAVDDTVPADKFMNKFVINGVNKNIKTMADHLGRNSEAHQHMAAGTINWLKDKAGIVDETGNFSQAGYNRALKQLDATNNLNEIFTPESASQLKTLGNVARYTQAQPRGAFVNNSNTLVGALAEKAKQLTGKVAEQGLNLAVPGLQLGTSVMEMRARRAAAAESKKALEVGAGTKLKDIGK